MAGDEAREGQSASDPDARDALDAQLNERELPSAAAVARRQLEQIARELAPTTDRRIDAHLSAASVALDVVDAAQRHIADNTDLELEADTRQLAVWLLIGRLVGLARAAVALLRAGYATEVAPTLRVMHETSRILHTVADRGEVDLLERWLRDGDDYVRPREARGAIDRIRLRTVPSMEEAKELMRQLGHGALVDELDRLSEGAPVDEAAHDYLASISLAIYDGLSRVAHARRSGMTDSLSIARREFVTGPHPDPRMRAVYTEYTGIVIEEALLAIGDGISLAFMRTYFTEQVFPLVQELAKVRAAHPLDPDQLEGLA